MNQQTKIEIIANGSQANATINQMAAAVRILEKELKQLPKDSKEFIATSQKLGDVKNEYKKITAEVIGLHKASTSAWGGMKGGIAAVFGGNLLTSAFNTIKNLGASLIDITSTYQKYNAVLTNSLGSQLEATKAMEQLQSFASKTPFSIDQITESYIKLVNRGFKPTMDEMGNLGDLAASLGKNFDQLVEAVLDAQTGEFVRLKEFGIRAQKNGDLVKFTFKGITTEVKYTDKAIQDYVIGLGNLKGVQDTMAMQSATLGGTISNLKDSFTILGQNLGKKLAPIFSGAAKLVSNLASSFGAMSSETNAANEEFDKMIAGQKDMQAAMNVDLEVLKDKNLSETARRDLLKEVNTLYGEYLPYLLTEKSSIEDITAAQMAANEAFDRNIFLKTYEKEITDANQKVLAAQKAVVAREIASNRTEQAGKLESDDDKLKKLNLRKRLINIEFNNNQQAIDDAKENLKNIEEIYSSLSKSKFKKSINELVGEKITGTSAGSSNTSGSGKGKSAAKTGSSDPGADRLGNAGFRAQAYQRGALEELQMIPTVEGALNDAHLKMRKRRLDDELAYAIVGSKKEFDLRMALLDNQEQYELSRVKDDEEQKTEIQEYYANLRAQMETDRIEQQAQKYKQYFDAVIALNDAFIASKNQKENQDLANYVKGEDVKRAELKRRLDKDLISQEKYQMELDKINAEQAAREKQVKQQQWQRQHNADIAKAIADGIMATISSLKVDPTGILAGVVGATNAVLIAKLASQQMPEFAYGGATVTGQSGRSYNATAVGSFANGGAYSTPSYGIIGEAGPELVIPNYLYTAPKMANTMRMLESMIGMREFAGGGSTNSTASNGQMEALIKANISATNQLIARLSEPIKGVAYVDPVQANRYQSQIDSLKESSRMGSN